MARSIAAMRSRRQCSAWRRTSSSIPSECATAPSNSWLANVRVFFSERAFFQKPASMLAGSWRLISHWNNIWRANSRALCRSAMLAGSAAAPSGNPGFHVPPQLAHERGHLERGDTGLKAFVATLQSGAVNGLLECVAGQHAEDHRYTRIHLSKLHAPRYLGGDVLEMGGLTTQDAANGDHRVIPARACELLCREGDLE